MSYSRLVKAGILKKDLPPENGILSTSAKELLKILNSPLAPDEISQKLNRPMFKVRSSAEEMLEAELISLVEDKYVITEEGKKKI